MEVDRAFQEDDRVDFGSEENKRKKIDEGILGQRI